MMGSGSAGEAGALQAAREQDQAAIEVISHPTPPFLLVRGLTVVHCAAGLDARAARAIRREASARPPAEATADVVPAHVDRRAPTFDRSSFREPVG